ncbi:hypothetical protein M1349_03550 [Patescibacteria group bacterium]|nr:hypothetical protein [Patescibacteria group bacterium]
MHQHVGGEIHYHSHTPNGTIDTINLDRGWELYTPASTLPLAPVSDPRETDEERRRRLDRENGRSNLGRFALSAAVVVIALVIIGGLALAAAWLWPNDKDVADKPVTPVTEAKVASAQAADPPSGYTPDQLASAVATALKEAGYTPATSGQANANADVVQSNDKQTGNSDGQSNSLASSSDQSSNDSTSSTLTADQANAWQAARTKYDAAGSNTPGDTLFDSETGTAKTATTPGEIDYDLPEIPVGYVGIIVGNIVTINGTKYINGYAQEVPAGTKIVAHVVDGQVTVRPVNDAKYWWSEHKFQAHHPPTGPKWEYAHGNKAAFINAPD